MRGFTSTVALAKMMSGQPVCPKCEVGWVRGPSYESGAGGERLRYTCTCGYSWTAPTADSKGRAPTTARPKGDAT